MNKNNLFEFYNKSKEYFDSSERAHLNKSIFPIHRKILNRCRKKRGLIVDLGCGTGLDIVNMVSNDNFCIGIDISQLAINRANSRKIKNASFKKSDLEDLFLKDESVDVITSFYVFEHLFNPEKVLSEIDRVLKKNGEAFILCPSFASPFRGAPIFGGIRKIRIIKKAILSLFRIFSVWIFKKKDFKVNMIEESQIDFSKVGEDWDATNEPSVFEFVNYFKNKNYKVFFDSWLTPPKTKIEKFFSYFKELPIVKYWGPIIYIHAQKK